MKVMGWSGQEEVEIDRDPDACPICHHGIQPIKTQSAFLVNSSLHDLEIEVVLRCPRHQCGRFFIARYSKGPWDRYESKVRLRDCQPWSLQDFQFDEGTRNISPDFVSIYNEAQKAEQLGLELACGPAYRKALEFLIKDYLITLHPAEVDVIQKMLLGACIQKYVNDPRLKATAKRAAWLGNDETHYLRKWEGQDLADLKTLIQLTTHWIQMEELTRKSVEDMPDD